MNRFLLRAVTRRLTPLAAALLVVLTGACTEPTGTEIGLSENDAVIMPGLTISEARSVVAGSAGLASTGTASASDVAYVSAEPGTIPGAIEIRIRNLKTADAEIAVAVRDGGFDPVAIPARAGDRLELLITDFSGAFRTAHIVVPDRRPPVVVRTNPPRGRTDVAFSVRPVVIFSEPIDRESLDEASITLLRDGTVVSGAVDLVAGSPFAVEFAPDTMLKPLTAYELVVTTSVHDLGGDALEEEHRVPFSTSSAQTDNPPGESPPPPPPASSRIAFVRSFSEGSSAIFIANADGSVAATIPMLGACGQFANLLHTPRLSPDGTRLLIAAGGMSPEGTCVIGVDGSRSVMLRDVYDNAKWSPDGARLLYYDWNGFSTIGSDGSGYRHLLSQDELPGPREPVEYRSATGEWIDQNTIAFIWNGAIWSMKPDGSDVRRVGTVGADIDLYSANWSPDGRRIAFTGPDPANSSLHVVGSMAANGTDVQIHLTTATGAAAPEWSPDGRQIAFHSLGPNARIHVVDVQTGAVTQLVADVGGAQGPTYSDWLVTWAAILD